MRFSIIGAICVLNSAQTALIDQMHTENLKEKRISENQRHLRFLCFIHLRYQSKMYFGNTVAGYLFFFVFCKMQTKPIRLDSSGNSSTFKFLRTGFYLLLFWNLSILAAPYWAASDVKFLQYLGSLIYFFMDPVCHQLPERSLFLAQLPMPVCARCFFIYSAGLFVTGFAFFTKRFRFWPRYIYVLMALFSASEILAEKIHLYDNWIELRALSGFVLGILIFRLILEGIIYGNKKDTH